MRRLNTPHEFNLMQRSSFIKQQQNATTAIAVNCVRPSCAAHTFSCHCHSAYRPHRLIGKTCVWMTLFPPHPPPPLDYVCALHLTAHWCCQRGRCHCVWPSKVSSLEFLVHVLYVTPAQHPSITPNPNPIPFCLALTPWPRPLCDCQIISSWIWAIARVSSSRTERGVGVGGPAWKIGMICDLIDMAAELLLLLLILILLLLGHIFRAALCLPI